MPTSETPITPEDDIELPQALPADDKKGNDKKGNNKKKSSSNNKTGKTSTNKKDGVLYLKSNPGSGTNGSGSTGTGLQALNAKRGNTFKYGSNDAVKPASATTNATHNTTQKDQELKTASMLPQTGDTHATNWLAVLGLSMLGLLGLAKFRKRRN
jgi:LPXTG-motif cell wall-anchored protein